MMRPLWTPDKSVAPVATTLMDLLRYPAQFEAHPTISASGMARLTPKRWRACHELWVTCDLPSCCRC